MNKRLTLIRRANNACQEAMRRAQFGDAVLMDNLRRAHHWLVRAKKVTLGGNDALADLALRNACTFIGMTLHRIQEIS